MKLFIQFKKQEINNNYTSSRSSSNSSIPETNNMVVDEKIL